MPQSISIKLFGVMGVAVCLVRHLDHLNSTPDVASRLRLRPANRHQLIVPRCRLNTYGRRAFSVAGPTVWNTASYIPLVYRRQCLELVTP